MSHGRDEDFAIEMLFDDPSPHGHINKRINNAFILNLDKVDLGQPEREDLMNLLLLLSKKLATTWGHLDRYRKAEDVLVEKAKETPLRVDGKRTGFSYSDELYAEFDGFLVQMKSSLDYLANVPRPVFGPGWKPYSFGDKGDDVIKLLQNNTPKRFAGQIPVVCDLIRWNQHWLQEAIDLRDRVNHFQRGGVPYQYFRVDKVERDGKEVVRIPMWTANQTVRDALSDIWRKLMCFCEAFIGFTLYMRLKPYWGVRYEHHEDEGQWEADDEADDEAEDRRWEFELDLEAVQAEVRGEIPESS